MAEKVAPLPIHSLDNLVFKFLKGQRVASLNGDERADFNDATLSADAYVLAREIDLWMFGTVEGRLWATRRLNQQP